MYYSDQWQVLEERQEDDSVWKLHKQYVWGIRYIDELILRDQDTSNPPNGTLNQRHYALQDANFNVVALINTNGSVGRRYSYDAYGHSTTLEADFTPGAYEYDFEYRYAGYRWDYETHLLQVRNRWYHPRLGRWLSRDPFGYAGGTLNLYEYVQGQPVNSFDPMGLADESIDSTITCGDEKNDGFSQELNIRFFSCSKSHRKTLESVVCDTYKKVRSIQLDKGSMLMRRWFGDLSDKDFKKVQKVFEKVRKGMVRGSLVAHKRNIHCECKCEPGFVAYTKGRVKEPIGPEPLLHWTAVHICPPFWEQNAYEMSEVYFHELTRAIAP
jgi:RHS repeat-associated protein